MTNLASTAAYARCGALATFADDRQDGCLSRVNGTSQYSLSALKMTMAQVPWPIVERPCTVLEHRQLSHELSQFHDTGVTAAGFLFVVYGSSQRTLHLHVASEAAMCQLTLPKHHVMVVSRLRRLRALLRRLHCTMGHHARRWGDLFLDFYDLQLNVR